MTNDQTTGEAVADRLNDLYWNSGSTVDEILQDAGVGRSALYGAIRPLRASGVCPRGHDALVFTNRTNRASGSASCTICGLETIVDGDEMMAGSRRDEYGLGNGLQHDENGWSRWREDLAHVAPERAALIGGAAALGVMVGAAAARALRH
jgi:hypothetical protein